MEVILRTGEFAGGGGTLFRRDALPAGETWAHLVIAHGYGDHSGRYAHFMHWMAQRGVACHALDFRGHGRSGGARGFVRRWEEYLADFGAFLALEDVAAARPRFVLGHSHGALVVTMAALDSQLEAKGAILSSPYFHNRVPVPVYKVVLGRVLSVVAPWARLRSGIPHAWLSRDAEMCRDRAGDSFALAFCTPRWFFSVRPVQRRVLRRAGEFAWPMLLLTGGDDRLADVAASERFLQFAGSVDKTWQHYPQMRHEVLRECEREEVFERIRAWMRERA